MATSEGQQFFLASFADILVNFLRILGTKWTISQKKKDNVKLIFHSVQHTAHLLCEYGHFGGTKNATPKKLIT